MPVDAPMSGAAGEEMNLKKTVLTTAIAALTACSMAQGFGQGSPGGPGGPGGRMEGRGGFGGPMMGGGVMSPDMLISRQDVQTDLAVTDDQKAKLDAAGFLRGRGGPGGPRGERGGPGGPPPGGEGGGRGGFGGPPSGGQGGFGGPGGQGGPGGNPDEMRKQFEEMRKQRMEELKKILTSEQYARLQEISVQLAGNAAVLDSDVQKALALTDAQKSKIKTLQQQQMEAGRALAEQVQDGQLDRDQIRAMMQRNQEILNAEFGKVLTDAQRTKLKAMGGTTFKATDPQRGPGGPGFPGGGGGGR